MEERILGGPSAAVFTDFQFDLGVSSRNSDTREMDLFNDLLHMLSIYLVSFCYTKANDPL